MAKNIYIFTLTSGGEEIEQISLEAQDNTLAIQLCREFLIKHWFEPEEDELPLISYEEKIQYSLSDLLDCIISLIEISMQPDSLGKTTHYKILTTGDQIQLEEAQNRYYQ